MRADELPPFLPWRDFILLGNAADNAEEDEVSPFLPWRDFILLGIIRSVAEALEPGFTTAWRDGRGLAMLTRAERAKQGGWTPYRPKDWSEDSLTPRDRKDLAAELRRLETEGLVESERDPTNRPVWVRLTPAGWPMAHSVADYAGMSRKYLDDRLRHVEGSDAKT